MTLRFAAVIVLVAAIGACAPAKKASDANSGSDTTTSSIPADAPPTPEALAVDAGGFGPIRIGMTVGEAEQALGDSLTLLGPKMEPCYYVVATARPGIAFMIIEGRLARLDVEQQSTVQTDAGAKIGDTEDHIRSLYPGHIEVQPHKYTDGHYLIVTPTAPAHGNHRIIFETDGKRVTGYRAGRLPEVQWVEGCS